MIMRISPAALAILALTLSASSPGWSAPDLGPRSTAGHVHPAIAAGKILGVVDRALPMDKMILALKENPATRAAREAFLKDQLDPRSPSYHHWLTPQQYGAQFGPSQADLAEVTGWLKAQGFHIDQVAPGGNAIIFSGTAGAVMDTFRTTIAAVEVQGQKRQGNLTAPTIPAAMAERVEGLVSLHNIPMRPMNTGGKVLGPLSTSNVKVVDPHFTAPSGNTFLAPGDWATIYNTQPLLSAGKDGTGMVIAIAGRTDILVSDYDDFRNFFGLPPDKLAITYNGPNPGIVAEDEGESDLDVQWSGAVAPNATIEFVTTASTNASDGVTMSILYIINNNVAPVVSISYGTGEQNIGPVEVSFMNSVYGQAAAQGMTVMVSSGDSGCAGDQGGSDSSGSVLAVNGLGSSPYNVSVGGTEFAENGGNYWAASNSGPGKASALGYIPEGAWNESADQPGGTGLWSGGGGFSIDNPQPWWQASLVSSSYRALPDVAFTAASHDGYIVASEGQLEVFGGTSCAAPSFAGMMALVVQATGQRQGNINPMLYTLGNNQFNLAGPVVFHDVQNGDNSVPGLTGFNAGVGFDEATGLGSINGQALAANWIKPPSNTVTAAITAPTAAVHLNATGTQTFTATGTDTDSNEILTYTWTFGDGAMAVGATVSHTYVAGNNTRNYPVTCTVTDSVGNLAAATTMVQVASMDVNHDGATTLLDMLQWSIDFTTQNLQGDLNGDGIVTDADLLILIGGL